MDDDLDFDQTQAVVISDFEDDGDLTDDLESSGEKEPSAYLRVQPQNNLPASSYPVYEGDNIIGRQADTCHVCIPSKSLSKEHSCIQITGDSHLIFDKGSRNKTRRGKLVLKPEVRYELKHGDEISFADVKCVYEIMKQISEIVPESDTETDAESNVSESLNLKHDVTDQSDKLIDLTGDRLDNSGRGVGNNEMQHTLVLSESESDDDDGPIDNLGRKQRVVHDTVVFECSDDDDSSLDLLGMATQAYTKTVSGKDSPKPGKTSKTIAATQKYFPDAEEEIAGTQSFDVEASSDEEGIACSEETRNKITRCKASKAATKSRQATKRDSEEHSNDASDLFAVSTLAYDTNDFVDVSDDDDRGSCEERPLKETADKNRTAVSKPVSACSEPTVAVTSDATMVVASDATVAVASNATIDVSNATEAAASDTVAVCSDATVAIPSGASPAIKSSTGRANRKVSPRSNRSAVLSKSAGPAVKISSLRVGETLIAQDVGSASEELAEDNSNMPTQMFNETTAVGGSCSENASAASQKRRDRYPAGAECSAGATVPVDDVLPVSRKIFAGSRSKGLQSTPKVCAADEPTQVFADTSEEPTQFLGDISNEPTQAYRGMSDEPTQAYSGISDEGTQAYGGISDEPTQDYGGISDEPSQVYDDVSDNPSQVRSGISDEPPQTLNNTLDAPTQILNDSAEMPNDHDTYNEATQTFAIDSDEIIITKKNESVGNLPHRKDLPRASDGGTAAAKKVYNIREASVHGPPVVGKDMGRNSSGGTETELDVSDEDEDATQAFVDEEEEDGVNYVSRGEDPEQRYFMEAEERLEKDAGLEEHIHRGSTDAPSGSGLDSSDDSDLEELSVLRSSEVLPDDPSQLFESTSKSHTSESITVEPTMKYDMAIDKDPTLPYDLTTDKDPTLPYNTTLEELPGKSKKQRSPKRRGHKDSRQDNHKELDTSADTKQVSKGKNSCTEISSPVILLPAKSPLKSALVDRRRSPSPAPGNRHVAFAVTMKEDSVDKQTLAGGSVDTCQRLASGKSDQGIPSPSRLGRSRNQRSLQQTTEIEQSNDEKSQGEISNQEKFKSTRQIQTNMRGIAQNKEDDLEIQGQNSGKGAPKLTGASHRASTRRSKANSAAGDVKAVDNTPPLGDDPDSIVSSSSLVSVGNSIDSIPPLAKDVSSVGSTPPLIEDSSKEHPTPQMGNKKRKIQNEQEDNGLSGKESDIIVASASKKGRGSMVEKTEEAVESRGRRSSARPRKNISYQQLATGVEKRVRSVDPQGEAESVGTAPLISDNESGNTASKKSATPLKDIETKAKKTVATSLDDRKATVSRKSATPLNDSNTKAEKTVASKKSATSLDDSNTSAKKTLATSLDNSNTSAKKTATSMDDSNTNAKKTLATPLNDSNTNAKKTVAVPLDDSNTSTKKTVATPLNDSNTNAKKTVATLLDDSNTNAKKTVPTSLDENNTNAKKTVATSLDENNTNAKKTVATSLDIGNPKARKKSATVLDNSNTTLSQKSAKSLDDSNTSGSKISAASLDESQTTGKKESANSLHGSKTKANKKATAALNGSKVKATKHTDSSNTASEQSATLLDNSSNKDSDKTTASLDDSNATDIKKDSKKVPSSGDSDTIVVDQQQNIRRQRPTRQPKENADKEKLKKKSTRKSVNTKTAEKDDNESDETASLASFVDDSTSVGDETPVKFTDDSSGKDKEQLKTGMASENTRRSRTTRMARESDAKEQSKKMENHHASGRASSDSVSATSGKINNELLKTGVTSGSIRRSRATRTARESDTKEASKKISNSGEDPDSVSATSRKIVNERLTKIDNEQSTTEVTSGSIRRSRATRTARESDTKEASKKISNSGEDPDSVSATSRKIVNERLTKIDNEQSTTEVASENTRRSRTSRENAKEASQKIDNSEVIPDFISTTSRKRLHPTDTAADKKRRQFGKLSHSASDKEMPTGKQSKKTVVIVDDPGSESSLAPVDLAPADPEPDSEVRAVKNVRGRASKAAKLDAGSEALPSTDSKLCKHDDSQENFVSPKLQQKQVVPEKTSRIATRKSLQVEEKVKTLPQKQQKTQASHESGRAESSKAADVSSEPQTEEIQTPPSRGKRATKSLVNSEASADLSGSQIPQSEEAVSLSSSQTSSSRKSAKASDIRGRGRKSGRATPTNSENVSEKAGSSQNSAGEHDKSSQVSATDKTKLSQNSAVEKDEGSQNSTNLKRRRTTGNKLSQESQTNTHIEQTEEQTSTPRAKKSKQTPILRTPTGRVHTETADSPVLRKSAANSKPRVMFTGYLDKQGEKIVGDLGGELVTGVQECSHLVTDRICRTVKFLSGLAKGLLIVSPRWLESCKQAATFVDGHQFLVSDPVMEKQYKFNLATSISKAQAGPLLAGYKVHVTRSVKPDPSQMQDILKFAGAQYMKSMPSKPQEKLVVISCAEDQPLCLPAIKAGIPVVGAEFILTGILRQELDLESFSLFQTEAKSPKKTGKKK